MTYDEFINSKRHIGNNYGFKPIWMPDNIFDFQAHIAEKAVYKGRLGIFIDTGLGKTRISLTIAQNIILKTNKNVLILTPLAVAFQFLKEAEEIGIDDIEYSKDGKFTKKIIICNYERLHYFNSTDFECVICDESSILKNFNGAIKTQITDFVRKIPYRFLTTATPSPNDFIEFGTSSEALGELGYMDMLQKYFRSTQNDIDSNNRNIGEKFVLKPHARVPFFTWVNSWSIMMKRPSDIGFSDERYILPELIENIHWIENITYEDYDNQMSLIPISKIAKTMTEVRTEQKNTEHIRCEKAVELTSDKVSVYWCNTNNESKILKTLDKSAIEIIGSQSIDEKEEILKAFANNEIKRIITKSTITGMGLNWQHCNHSVFFPTWSYEQYYQSVRRFWRFGQKYNVTIDLVLSDRQQRVLQALTEKKAKALELYENLICNVNMKHENYKKSETCDIKKPLFI